MTFIEAARYISNYSAGHETHTALNGNSQFAQSVGYIEADNRFEQMQPSVNDTLTDKGLMLHEGTEGQQALVWLHQGQVPGTGQEHGPPSLERITS